MKAALWWRHWCPPVLYLALIFTLSSFSNIPHPQSVSFDTLHYPEYAVLALLLARALQATFPGDGMPAVLAVAFVASVLWGATDEIHQAFVPGRVPDLSDLAHDAMGAAAGCMLWYLVDRVAEARRRRTQIASPEAQGR